MVKSIVIGGNGFIGSHLVDALVLQGHEVTAFDRFSTGVQQFTSSGVNIRQGDFLNISDLHQAVAGQDYVFHFLSITTPATAEDDPTLDIRTNVVQTVELLKLASLEQVRHVYFGSTGGAIYGPQGKETYSESDRALPISPYGIGKLTIEHYLDYFRTKKGLNSTSLRISNPYGTRQKPRARQGLIPIALRNIASGKPILRYGDGSMVRDFVYVKDAVQMITQLVGRENLHNLYNIGSGLGVSVNEVIETIRETNEVDFVINEIPVPPTFVDKVILDTTRFCDEFGVPQLTSLRDGILLTSEEINS